MRAYMVEGLPRSSRGPDCWMQLMDSQCDEQTDILLGSHRFRLFTIGHVGFFFSVLMHHTVTEHDQELEQNLREDN